MKLHSTKFICCTKFTVIVAAISTHRHPRMFVHPTRFPNLLHAKKFAAKVKAAGAFSPEVWVEVDVKAFLTDGTLRSLAGTEKAAA